MRKVYLMLSCLLVCGIIIFQSANLAYSNKVGAVKGVTGSPHDGKTCAQTDCHPSPATPLANLISSNVPVTGYMPGNTYTITAIVSSPNLVRFGFEISPQDSAGILLGTLIITDPARMHFTGLGQEYLTHDTLGTWAPDHVAVWSFNWVAPDSGTGCVTFYGAFNYANNNKLSTGDTIHTSTLTICENTTGINEPIIINALSIYPNPVVQNFEFSYYLQRREKVSIHLLNEEGSAVAQLFDGIQDGGAQKLSAKLDNKFSSGIYFLQLTAGENIVTKKIVKL